MHMMYSINVTSFLNNVDNCNQHTQFRKDLSSGFLPDLLHGEQSAELSSIA